MAFLTVFLISLGLAMDSFAVSLGIGTSQNNIGVRTIGRMAFHMALFQGAITFLGWLAGSTIAGFIATFDHWVALALLSFVGVHMIKEGLDKQVETTSGDPTRGGTMIVLCIATSIDAFAVGLSMAMMDVKIIFASLMVAGVTLLLSIVGMLAGSGLGARFGKRMEVLGGLILIFIGVRVVFTHLVGA